MNRNYNKAYLGLGSNVGEREGNLASALKTLQASPEIQVERISPLYFTEPVGYLEQDNFINAVAEIATSLLPEHLLAVMQNIEISLGRVRTICWGPRTIDLDILLYEDITIDTPLLTIPHPRMLERAFVLQPLADLEPHLVINGATISHWLVQVKEQKINLFKSVWFDKLS